MAKRKRGRVSNECLETPGMKRSSARREGWKRRVAAAQKLIR